MAVAIIGREEQLLAVVLTGSPRAGGATSAAAEAVAGGLKDAGARVERLAVSELSIAPCAGLHDCDATGTCHQHDDFDRVADLLTAAARLVICSPVYFQGMPAQLKALVDRCQVFHVRKYILGKSSPVSPDGLPRVAALVGLSGSTRKGSFDGLLAEASALFAARDFQRGPTLLIPGTDQSAPSAEQLKQARELGKSLASWRTGG